MNISQRLRTCAKHTALDAVIELLNEAADEIDALQARTILALRPVQVPMTDADTVQVFGVKDGKETLLGTAPMPARMKARELARENFGNFEDGDGSDAELCFGALEQLIDHIERNAHHGITAQAKKEDA